MILGQIRVSNGAIRRPPTDSEAGPSRPKIVNQIYHDAAARRRASLSGKGTPKYRAEQAKRRREAKKAKAAKKAAAAPKTAAAPQAADVQMAASSTPLPSTTQPRLVPVTFPNSLRRPPYKEVDADFVAAHDPDLAGMDMEFFRSGMDGFGPMFFESVRKVRPLSSGPLTTKEFTVRISDDKNDVVPSHMLAISDFNQDKIEGAPPKRRKITMVPVHSLIILANCANINWVPPTVPAPEVGETVATLPVWMIRLPAPATFILLLKYLYTKDVMSLMNSFMPLGPPPGFEGMPLFQQRLGEQMGVTVHRSILLAVMYTVQGLWRNVCSLGIFDDMLWAAMDAMWRSLHIALHVSTRDL